jgi:hypothetical protein
MTSATASLTDRESRIVHSFFYHPLSIGRVNAGNLSEVIAENARYNGVSKRVVTDALHKAIDIAAAKRCSRT